MEQVPVDDQRRVAESQVEAEAARGACFGKPIQVDGSDCDEFKGHSPLNLGLTAPSSPARLY